MFQYCGMHYRESVKICVGCPLKVNTQFVVLCSPGDFVFVHPIIITITNIIPLIPSPSFTILNIAVVSRRDGQLQFLLQIKMFAVLCRDFVCRLFFRQHVTVLMSRVVGATANCLWFTVNIQQVDGMSVGGNRAVRV